VNRPAPIAIPADVRSRLKALRLVPRRASGALGTGQHASRSRGAGLEFAQYRAYEPGDELRQIDWKLYARSDRFFVRESERESPVTAWVLVDASASARQHDRARPDWSRLDHACATAACLVELALQQGDRFGVIALNGAGVQLLSAGSGPRQRDRAHLLLRQLRAQGGWPDESALRTVWERVHAGDMLIALGDGFDEAGTVLLERLAAARRDVHQVQLLSAEERDFPFTEGHRFHDPETGEELLGDGRALRADYLARFDQAQRALQARLQAGGIAHAIGYLDQPLDAPLRALFGGGRAR